MSHIVLKSTRESPDSRNCESLLHGILSATVSSHGNKANQYATLSLTGDTTPPSLDFQL